MVDMETLLKGVCDKRNFLDLFENFILFDDCTGRAGQDRRPQPSVPRRQPRHRRRCGSARSGRASWASSGTPRARASPTRWCSSPARCTASWAATSPSSSSPTATTSTPRSTRPSPAAGVVDNDKDPCRAASGEHLKALLAEHKAYVFSLIQKFNQDVDPDEPTRHRDDIIVITDEAHRTQYGTPGAEHAQRPAERQLHRLHRHAALQGRRDHPPGLRRLRLHLRLPAGRRRQRHRAALLRRTRREAGRGHR